MRQPSQVNRSPWLIWIYSGDISNALDAVTWLEVTKELRNLSWRVDLVSFGPDGKFIVDDVEVLGYSVPDFYFIRHLFFHMRIIFYILRNWRQIDIVLFHQTSAPLLLPLRLLDPFSPQKHPLFVMDTRTVPMEPIEKSSLKDKLRGKFSFLMNSLANNLADGQTAITQRMADLLHIPSDKLWGTWPSSVNLDNFTLAGQKRRWPEADDAVQLIYIGVLNYERNLMPFCQTVMEANRRGMNFSFNLYGDGTERQDLLTFASQTQGKIKVFEPVPHDQIPEILGRAQVGILPFPDEDKFRVSSPVKLFEYMGAGLPILATKIVCHTDVIGTGDYVFWADNSDPDGMLKALEHTWQKRFNLPILSKKALAAAQEWTWHASAKKLKTSLEYGLKKNQ